MATQVNKSMTSEVSICNQALSFLGEESIRSLDDSSTTSQLCRDNYPFLRDAVIEEAYWTFASARATSEVSDMDDWGLMYKHPLPLEWLQVFRVYSDVTLERKVTSKGWVREGEYILARDPIVYMKGVMRIVDTNKFSNLFVQALAERIAMDLAMPITENQALMGARTQLYGAKMDIAKAADGGQGAPEKLHTDTFIAVRGKGGG